MERVKVAIVEVNTRDIHDREVALEARDFVQAEEYGTVDRTQRTELKSEHERTIAHANAIVKSLQACFSEWMRCKACLKSGSPIRSVRQHCLPSRN